MDYSTCRSPRTWPMGHVYSFCRGRGLDPTTAVNAVWAIVLWEYTSEENIFFRSQNCTDESRVWNQCGVSIDSTSKFYSVLHHIHRSTKQVSGPTAITDDPLLSQRSGFLNTVTVFQKGDPCCTESTLEGTHFTALVCNLPETALECAVHFAHAVIDRREAERLASAFAHVMDLVLSSTDETLDSVDLVSDHDKAELWAWNNAQAPESINHLAHVLFQRQVASQPHAIAVDAWDGSFTYGSLDRISTQIAHHLIAQGVGPEVLVPLCFDKSCWAIAALLGVIKAGGAMVFIDPANPESRRREIMSQVNSDYILTNASHAASWESMGIRPVVIENKLVECLREYGASPRTGVTPDNLLYVVFTSGTTGRPKGCLITHNAFLSGALQHASKSNLGSGSRVMQLASYSFDVSVLEIVTSLISGACVCTPDSAAMTQGLASIINHYQITWAFLTPSLVKLVKPCEVPSLETLILGGEKLHKADIEAWAGHLQLINGYGPSECSIAAAGDPRLTTESDPANIGRSIGGLAWMVQPDDHDKLVPIGGVGELLISGPILARGYLNNPDQTSQHFIENPRWAHGWAKGPAGFPRFYKTGDLAKFNSDGTIHFIGRKDTQVKLRGLRIELGEIEHNISQHQHVKHVAVSLQKMGPCKDKLVAVLSLHGFSKEAKAGLANAPINLVSSQDAMVQTGAVRRHLAECVPEYMIPSLWIVIEAWPLLASAKLDRKHVQRWLADMDEDFYRGLIGLDDVRAEGTQLTSDEKTLCDIYSRVLNLSSDLIPLDKPFLGLGGDSITAMQVMAQCRSAGISVTVKDILRSKSIPELALCARKVTKSVFDPEETFDHPFQLSPIQRMYASKMRSIHEELPEVHFNQSFFIRLTKSLPRSVIKDGLNAVVSQHSMLRTRFAVDQHGWSQKVLSRAEGSYRYKCHVLRSIEDVGSVGMLSQRTLGLSGPVFSADLLELEDQQYLFLVAHHAIIDWVSWRIVLRDLEAFFSTGTLGDERPFPFQNWINLQAEHAAQHGDPAKTLPFDIPTSDFAYWDMEKRPNPLSDTVEGSFKLGRDSTALLLGGEAHRALRTEILDFLLASLFHTFGQVFNDRSLPAIFREGHGREPWDSELDVSGTVGWFTTMYPLAIDASSADDIVSTVKKVKDIRHRVPDNGRPYFASRFHNDSAAEKFQGHEAVEISFDYLGQFQALDRPDAIVRQEPRPAFLPQSDDVGRNVDRLSLIEITAEVIDGELQHTFSYNKRMKHQDRIRAWIDATKQTLESLIVDMLTAPIDFTLTDFPLLKMTYGGLDTLLKRKLPQAGFDDLDNVEEIYPCSPMQNGLLLSQSLSGDGVYEYRQQMEMVPCGSRNFIDAERVAKAWSQVVQWHTSLRTVFVESTAGDGLFDQLVLKSAAPMIRIVDCDEQDTTAIFRGQKALPFRSQQPPHRLTICRVATDKLVCQLEINHAIVDGSSVANIVRDLSQAYDGHMTSQYRFKFSEYIGYLQGVPESVAMDFWSEYLAGQGPCLFPALAPLEGPVEDKRVGQFDVSLSLAPEDVKAFCERSNITPLSLFQVAWAMVLKVYTESPKVCFGYLSSGRDADLPGIENGVGAFITMLVCSLDLTQGKLSDVLQSAADDFVKSLPHQYCGLANIQRSTSLSSDTLFNTILSFHRDDDVPELNGSGIAIKSLHAHDPTEYALSVDIGILRDVLSVSMQFWSDQLTAEQVRNVASTLDQALCTIVRHPDTEVRTAALASPFHSARMLEFNGNGESLPSSDRLVFTDIESNARTHPDAEAICSWDGSWTYAELDDVTNRLGHYLRTVGVGPEVIVPHLFHKSAWAAITIISILKAGGAFVGLDAAHPRHRLQTLVADVNAAIVCVSPETAGLISGMQNVKEIVVDQEFVSKLPTKNGSPCPEVRPYNLSCVVFTSGTTAKPKTIAIEHSSMTSMTDLLGPPFKMGRDTRVFQFSAYPYDVSNHDILVTLQRGGCVCIPSEYERMNDPGGAIRRLGANWAALTATVLKLLRPEQVPSLKFVSSGGEAMDREVIETWAGAVELVNGYGPAETSVSVSVSDILTVQSSHSNIGRSHGAGAWIVDVDDHNNLAPLGAAGELLLEGPQLARGYLNNPEATAKAFVHDPKWAQAMTPGLSRRFYRTGDICRFNTDGTLTIIGRRDTMIKVNGQRVDLHEINHQVQSQLGNKGTVIIEGLPLAPNSKSLALVALLRYEQPGASSSPIAQGSLLLDIGEQLLQEHSALRSALQSRLPKYMIPSMYIPVSEIPTTRNGKLDRRRIGDEVSNLSKNQVARYSLQDIEKKAPETDAELALQQLWGEVLNRPIETIGANDDFFYSGGDSFSAMKLVAAARVRNMNINVPDIFKAPRLSHMALALVAGPTNALDCAALPSSEPFDLIPGLSPKSLDSVKADVAEQCGVQSHAIVDLYPCTALQEGLMALSTRLGSGAYKAQKVFRLTDDNFDVINFKKAWEKVAASVSILRTRIVSTKEAGTLQAVINSGLEWSDAEGDLQKYLEEDLKTPVTYGAPLLRLSLVHDAGTRYFVWSAHHAVYDGWSAGITLNQVRHALANHLSLGESVPYKEFVRYLVQSGSEEQNAFWETQFAEDKGVPTSFPTVPVGYLAKSHDTVKARLSAKVSSISTDVTIPPPAILRTAWAAVIAKYSDAKDVVFAVTLAGRAAPVPGILTINGPTIATVPVRISLGSDDTPVSQLLTEVHTQATETMPFEHTGLQNIRQVGQAARAAVDGIANLLVIQPSDVVNQAECVEGMEVVPRDLEDFDTYPLVIACHTSDDGTVDLEAKYDQSIISRQQMQRILRQYDSTIQKICAEPLATLGDIDTITTGDVDEIVSWNGPLPSTITACIHHVVAARTEKRPRSQAVCAWDGTFTYEELDDASCKLAAHLQDLGVGPEVKVGLCFEKSKWSVVAMLSVLKASGAYTHLNPATPTPMMKDSLQDLGATIVVCSPQNTSLFTDIVPHVVVADESFIEHLPAPTGPLRLPARPDNAAFVVFTSGSTGKPKAVVVEHRGFSSMQHYQGPQLGIGEDSRVLQFAAPWFDISNFDTFATLMRGGCVCIPSEEEKLSNLAGAINKYGVNWATMVPTAASILRPDDVPTLTQLSLGGETIRSDLHERWSRRVSLMNSYGPAECSVLTSMGSLTPSVSPQNIGLGLGCRTWITEKDNHNRLVSIGCTGELCVEGPIVTRGYHNNATMTAQSYIENPKFATQLGIQDMRMYKTGDLVRYESDGTLFIVGRKDTQVKIHGRRIECGEVEHHIVANGIPVDSVVVERVYEGGDEAKPYLAAFIYLGPREHDQGDSQLAIEPSVEGRQRLTRLRRTLQNVLQSYMVPSCFVVLEKMPLTQTGKKDRNTLRRIGAQLSPTQLETYRLVDTAGDATHSTACTTGGELQLRTLWAEVLGLAEESIHANDNFIQKGGDSIRAIALSSAARREGRTLAVSDIFGHPLLYQMAECLGHKEATDEEVAQFSLINEKDMMIAHAEVECGVSTDAIQDMYPSTPLQEGLMAISTRVPGAYIATRVFTIPKSIDLNAFKRAWEIAVDLFPILRTRIILGPQLESLQVVLNESLTWGEINGSVKTYLAQYGLSQVEYGQPLSHYAISTRSRKFIWISHHSLYDGFSASKLLSAVQNLYHGQSPLPGPNFNKLISHLANVDPMKSDDFWRRSLSGGSPSSFPRLPSAAYQPRPDSEFVYSFTMPHNKTAGFLKATILRAAWSLLTARYVESDDVVYGETLSGRNVPVSGVEDMLAPCFTTVPIRVRLDQHQSIRQFLGNVQEHSSAIIPFQHRGLQSLRGLGADVHDSLDFNNLFEIQEGGVSPADDFLTEVQDKTLLEGFFDQYAVVMECVLTDHNTITLEARYDKDVLSDWQMKHLCHQFGHVAQQLSTMNIDLPLHNLELISAEDITTIASWQETDDMTTVESTVHDIFGQQVALCPSSIAISGWDGEMTYLELDDLSTRLAKCLVSRGVKQDEVVPVCFEKSKWAIVAALGVSKAGGAVAQLGISQPSIRHQEILEDANAAFVITSRQQATLFEGIIGTLVIDEETITDMDCENAVLPKVVPSSAAYVLFTSGSTGRPKGIVVEHRNLCTSSSAHGVELGISAGTRVFQFAAYTFDISCADIFTTLQRGATICIPSEEERINDLPGAIAKYNADWMFLTPTVAQMIDPVTVPSLRTLVLGGEAPTEDNIRTWSDRLNLILIWGPAETTIYATCTPPTTSDTTPARLGNTMGCRVWLCEPDNHDKRTPVGCVGEIVLEGALVSRGYLNDEAKTAASYIQDPAWAKTDASCGNRPRRMYKTGDMARYDPDGVLRYVSRKDNQVKLHGQRLELGEVEHRILSHPPVRHAVARVPRAGPLKDKLVATLSYENIITPLSSDNSHTAATDRTAMQLLDKPSKESIDGDLSTIRQTLEESLPSYMVPSVWINVLAIPLNMNGKINRKTVNNWLEGIDQQLYQSLLQASDDKEATTQPSTQEEHVLQRLVGSILNLEAPSLSRSFLSLGGDSITAMQLRGKARTEGIDLTVQDVLKSKSLMTLAAKAQSAKAAQVSHQREDSGASFSLSPIQSLFLEKAQVTTHFNQSFILRINQAVTAGRLQQAVQGVVSRHSMLRARFHRDSDGTWSQSVGDDVEASFDFRVDDVDRREQVSGILETRNDLAMDIQNGPLLAAHLFNVSENDEQLFFLSAHHLVVDLVSWRIILNDLHELVSTGQVSSEIPLPFQTWLRLHHEVSLPLTSADTLHHTPAAEFEYWGMDGQPNVFGDVTTTEFALDRTLSEKLFGSSNDALNTTPEDIILAAIMHSFHSVFFDRQVPPVFCEGHGRESRSTNVDPNGTVGWFTSISPVHVASPGSELIETVRMTKDLRRKSSGTSTSYLDSFFTSPGRKHLGMEILFNYMGKYQQLETKDAFFSQVDLDTKVISASQVDDNLERFALIDVSVVFIQGQARISFGHNKNMRHQDKIHQWVTTCQDSIIQVTENLDCRTKQRTVSDFPLLPSLDSAKLVRLEENLADGGVAMTNVHDIHPCTPLQQHMLAAQEACPGSGLYEVEISQQIFANSDAPFRGRVNIKAVQEAWQKVIDHHAIMRTVFIPSTSRPGHHDQVVLSSYQPEIDVITCANKDELVSRIKTHKSLGYCDIGTHSEIRPHQRFTLFVTADGTRTACKLEVSHALVDGMSTTILFRDLTQAYGGRLHGKPGTAPYFGEYVAWLQKQSSRASVNYWRNLFGSTQPVSIPTRRGKHRLFEVDLSPAVVAEIPTFCRLHGVTMATFFQTVWALVLRQCVARTEDAPLFGSMTANRDAAIVGAEDMVGPMTSMLLCRSKLDATMGVNELLRRTHRDVLEAMEHQGGLAEALQEMDDRRERGSGHETGAMSLCNSVLSLQYVDGSANGAGPRRAARGPPRMKKAGATPLALNENKKNANLAVKRTKPKQTINSDDGGIALKVLSYRDPNEYDMSIGVQVINGDKTDLQSTQIKAGFAYWTDALSEARARRVMRAFQRCAEELIWSSGLRVWMVMRRLG